jgi:hypothetical protein
VLTVVLLTVQALDLLQIHSFHEPFKRHCERKEAYIGRSLQNCDWWFKQSVNGFIRLSLSLTVFHFHLRVVDMSLNQTYFNVSIFMMIIMMATIIYMLL